MRKFLTLLIALLALPLSACDAGKVTDPNDPRFDPTQFRFEDYKTRPELLPVFQRMFPVGTPKSYIDKILVDNAGASRNVTAFSELVRKAKEYKRYPRLGLGGGAKRNAKVLELSPETYVFYAGSGDSYGKSQWQMEAFYDKDEKILEFLYLNKFVLGSERKM